MLGKGRGARFAEGETHNKIYLLEVLHFNRFFSKTKIGGIVTCDDEQPIIAQLSGRIHIPFHCVLVQIGGWLIEQDILCFRA